MMYSKNLPRTDSTGSLHTPSIRWRHSSVLVAIGVAVVLFCLFGVMTSSVLGGVQAFVLTSVLPDRIYNHSSTLITVTGTSLPLNPHLMINGITVPDPNRVSSTVLTATIPPNLPSGFYTVSVSPTGAPGDVAYLPSALEVVNSGNGEVSAWQSVTALPQPRHSFAIASSDSSIYVMGGDFQYGSYSPSDPIHRSVLRASVSTNGELGDWQSTSSLQTRRAYFGSVLIDSNIYAIGGFDLYTNIGLSSTERSLINSDGSLSLWQSESNLTVPSAS